MQNRLQALRLDQSSILQNRRLEFRADVLFLGLCVSENNAALGQHTVSWGMFSLYHSIVTLFTSRAKVLAGV